MDSGEESLALACPQVRFSLSVWIFRTLSTFRSTFDLSTDRIKIRFFVIFQIALQKKK